MHITIRKDTSVDVMREMIPGEIAAMGERMAKDVADVVAENHFCDEVTVRVLFQMEGDSKDDLRLPYFDGCGRLPIEGSLWPTRDGLMDFVQEEKSQFVPCEYRRTISYECTRNVAGDDDD